MSKPQQIILGLGISVIFLCGCQSFDFSPSSRQALIPSQTATSEIEASFSKSELLFSSAQKFEKAGQIEEAIKLYEKAAQASSGNKTGVLEANRHLAILYDLSGQADKAKKLFQTVIKSTSPDAALYNDYGYFLLKQQDFGEAEQVLRTAYQKYPQNQRIATNLGMALVSLGRVEDGYQMFEATVGKADAASNVGAVLLQQGKPEEAKQWLHMATESGSQTMAKQILQFTENTNLIR